MRFTLTRIHQFEDSMFGVLVIGDLTFWTLERAWVGNEPRISCVPEGFYHLTPHDSAVHPDTFALEGETVSHWPTDGIARNVILLHPANKVEELSGCIAIGESYHWFEGRPFLQKSKPSTDQVLEKLRSHPDNNYLTIEREIG